MDCRNFSNPSCRDLLTLSGCRLTLPDSTSLEEIRGVYVQERSKICHFNATQLADHSRRGICEEFIVPRASQKVPTRITHYYLLVYVEKKNKLRGRNWPSNPDAMHTI